MISNTKKSKAFSLIELLVIISITSILTSVAILNFSKLIFSIKKSQTKNQLIADFGMARRKSQKSGYRTIIQTSADGKNYTLGIDRLPFSTTSPAVADEIYLNRELANNITITSSQSFIFNPQGMLIASDGILTTGTISLQQTVENTTSSYTSLTISSAGQITN